MKKRNFILETLSIIINLATWCIVIFFITYSTKKVYYTTSNVVDSLLGNVDKEYKEYTLILNEDTEYKNVLEKLEQEEIIFDSLVMQIDNMIQNVKRETIPQGTYVLHNKMNPNEINSILVNKQDEVSSIEKVITIKEGVSIKELAIILESKELVTAEDFVNIANTQNFKEDFPWLGDVSENYLEGYLYPDTYNFYINTTSEEIIYKLLARFEDVYSEYKESEEIIDMDLNKIITMASIIQKEVSVDSERNKLSSLIHNRLKENINLDMDSTIQYISNKRKETFTAQDIKIESPYNTYKNVGLPPKPICSPSKASIDAVFNPTSTVYLYFIDLGDNNYLFTNDYNEINNSKNDN